jgi:phytoene dehydrogenase-like protein
MGMKITIVGAGLAGLTAAKLLKGNGMLVRVLERASRAGGRARTEVEAGFHFNFGPHALYRGARGVEVLRRLGILPKGGIPATDPRANFAIRKGRLYPLPTRPRGLLTSPLLTWRGRLEMLKWFAQIKKADPGPATVEQWLDEAFERQDARQLATALFRVATYANDDAHQSARAALQQFRLALANGVLYLDGGWQTLVDALSAGLDIECGAQATNVSDREVVLANGQRLASDAVVLAIPPAEVEALTGVPVGRDLMPVRAACLTVGLRRLPDPAKRFALGMDQPLYFSVHSSVARLAPEGGALIHAAKYLGPQDNGDGSRPELEALLDLVQSGWRKEVVQQQFLPHMTVTHALVTPAGRPGSRLPGFDRVYVAGDWVGADGMLADAAIASAAAVAELITNRRKEARAA